jgi:glycosyltransferase involved in cell wall biosynthesis
MTHWHVLTPELPPQCGGVGDYTAQLAEALSSSGDRVSVYSPGASAWRSDDRVEVVSLPDRFGPASQQILTTRLDRAPSSRLLVQYVPAVFGARGANRSFCTWVRRRVSRGTDVRIMFHEPYLYLQWRPDHMLTALAQRSMARTLLEGERGLTPTVYFSTDAWRRYLVRYGPVAVAAAITLPIPSSIPCANEPAAVRAARDVFSGAQYLIGHFGTYGRHVAPLLRRIVDALLSSDSRIAMLCVGAGSDSFAEQFVAGHPAYRGRVIGGGRTSARDTSLALQACDVLVQPYPDGVTTRRTSVMAGLANACAVVTCGGPLTEPIWRETSCVSLAQSPATMAHTARVLLEDEDARASLRARARSTYAATFDVQHTIAALRSAAPARRSLLPAQGAFA